METPAGVDVTFSLRVHGGLCNRLQALMSYRAVHGRIQVQYAVDCQIGYGRFEDVFEPLSGVTFEYLEETRDRPTYEDNLPKGTLYANQPCPEADNSWWDAYRDLVLLPEHAARVKAYPSAVHIRRTDFTKLAKDVGVYVNDESFLRQIRQMDGPVYLATDNMETQATYIKAINDMGKGWEVLDWVPDHDNRHDNRATGLAHAAIDMYTCSMATSFVGTPGSSFSATIEVLRGLRGNV